MWLFRRTVVTPYSPKTPKISKALFTKLLMSLSASGTYVSWLLGRKTGDKDRSPCYTRIKTLFARRYQAETGGKALLPSPDWSATSGKKGRLLDL